MMKRIVAIFLAIMMLGSLAACGSKKETKDSGTGEAQEEKVEAAKEEKAELETFTWNEFEDFNVSLDAPKDQDFKFVEGQAETAPYENYPVFTFTGKNFIIEFTVGQYTYHRNSAWIEKYGETEENFEDFKKVLKEEIIPMPGTIEQVNGEEVVQQYYTWDGENVGITRYYNTDGFREDGWNRKFAATIFSLDDSADGIDALLEEEEVKAIYDSIRLEAK